MIASVNGLVRAIHTDRVVVEVGGVGLSILTTAATTANLTIGSPVYLFTSMVVREDSLSLFGFLDDATRSTFELVQTVSGIGPKVALAIMGAHSTSSLANAIALEDIKAIEKVSGIGRKGAQRLILELKGKLGDLGADSAPLQHLPVWREQLVAALTSLGFNPKESDVAISTVLSDSQYSENPSEEELSDILKRALQSGRR